MRGVGWRWLVMRPVARSTDGKSMHMGRKDSGDCTFFGTTIWGIFRDAKRKRKKKSRTCSQWREGLELDVSGVRQIYRSKSEERCNHRESTTVWGR